MAYSDWTPEFQDLWDSIPVEWGSLDDQQYDWAELLYEEGFQRYHDESDQIGWARQEFFDFLGIDDDYFDWDGWREAMGYELCHVRAKKRSPVIGRNLGCGRPLCVRLRMLIIGKCT